MSELNELIVDVPQVLINLRVRKKADLETIPGYHDLVKKIESELNGSGRIFIRFSGTEPVVRVLVEGPDRLMITSYAEQLASHIENHLNTL